MCSFLLQAQRGDGISRVSSVDTTNFDFRFTRNFYVLVVRLFRRIKTHMCPPLANELTL